jgi:putative methionine-R-sulfoxide reductase with GAF domain
LLNDSTLLGVLDLDSPDLQRFDADDQRGCEALARIVARHLAASTVIPAKAGIQGQRRAPAP